MQGRSRLGAQRLAHELECALLLLDRRGPIVRRERARIGRRRRCAAAELCALAAALAAELRAQSRRRSLLVTLE